MTRPGLEPAFPGKYWVMRESSHASHANEVEGKGMSVRQFACIAAMQGLLANPNENCSEGMSNSVAVQVIELADAVLKREQENSVAGRVIEFADAVLKREQETRE